MYTKVNQLMLKISMIVIETEDGQTYATHV
jgi:hypothetical protein